MVLVKSRLELFETVNLGKLSLDYLLTEKVYFGKLTGIYFIGTRSVLHIADAQ